VHIRTEPYFCLWGIIAFKRELDAQPAQAIVDRQFVEVIIATEALVMKAIAVVGG